MRFVTTMVGTLGFLAGFCFFGYAISIMPVIASGANAISVEVYTLQAIFYALCGLGAFLVAVLCLVALNTGLRNADTQQ